VGAEHIKHKTEHKKRKLELGILWLLCSVLCFLCIHPCASATTLANDSTLPNGIRISELPADRDSVELIVGYQAGVRSETSGSSGLAAIISQYLASSPPVRSIVLSAYGAGGELKVLNELDRTAFEVQVPPWALPMILDQLPDFFQQIPSSNPALVARARQTVLQGVLDHASDFRQKVEDEIRMALFGSHPYQHPIEGWKIDLERVQAEDIFRFFDENYGTDRAFVLMSGAVPDELRQKLEAVSTRHSRKISEAPIRVLNGDRNFKFGPDEPVGAVIFASPVPSVFYRSWYSVLVLDGLVRRSVPGRVETSLHLSIDPYYWELEVPVPPGQFAENVEQTVLQEIQRLQYTRARPEDLEAARADAEEFLSNPYVRLWFSSLGVDSRREEGLQWVRSFTADDMRGAARDLLVMNHVIASWSPKPRQNAVVVESLSETSSVQEPASPPDEIPLAPIPTPAFPSHTHPERAYETPQQLSSGVWLAASSVHAVFVANAGLTKLAQEPDTQILAEFQQYRPDRIFVLAPAAALQRVRTVWSAFKGNANDRSVVTPQGDVANIDLPALLIVKTAIDRKLIEAGLWNDAVLSIDARKGAALQIEAPSHTRAQIIRWIKDLATSPPSDMDFRWLREAAQHHLSDVLPDLQSLVWIRVPEYTLLDLETVSVSQVQDVAKQFTATN
jgi:hypothetical protein